MQFRRNPKVQPYIDKSSATCLLAWSKLHAQKCPHQRPQFQPPKTIQVLVSLFWASPVGLKVTASLGRDKSYTRIIDGQVRCITQEHIQKRGQLIWNVEFLTIFVPAWMIPPIYHSLRREAIKNAAHSHPYGVRSIRSTWFEDTKLFSQPTLEEQRAFQPMHGLKLVIKEDECHRSKCLISPLSKSLRSMDFSQQKLGTTSGQCSTLKLPPRSLCSAQ